MPLAAYTETVLHAFNGTDGANPSDALITDGAGNFFGTTGGAAFGTAGSVFKLLKPSTSGGSYTIAVLHTFAGTTDGQAPLSSLIKDPAGALFGTTFYGGAGGSGTVFKIQ